VHENQESVMLLFLLLTLLFIPVGRLNAQTRHLDIYWVDVEGGAATLVVSPSGESMLIDTGWPVTEPGVTAPFRGQVGTQDRDAKRIYAVAQKAGLKKIDAVVISHFHADHVGGLFALAKMIQIDKFYDRGDDGIEKENQVYLDNYKATADGKRTIVKAGDAITLRGVRVEVVTSNGGVLQSGLKGGGPNPLCANAENKEMGAPENARMVGVLVSYGKFKFVDMGDLDWEKEMELACPVNKLGTVTVYQTDRHGTFDSAGAPAFLYAIRPQIIVVNNGSHKGMGEKHEGKAGTPYPPAVQPPAGKQWDPYEKNNYLRMAKTPGIEGIWQMHLSFLDNDPNHNTSQDMIANLDETADDKGNWLKASVEADGKFTFTNSRNGFSKAYDSH
jgi:competence protein ComEC